MSLKVSTNTKHRCQTFNMLTQEAYLVQYYRPTRQSQFSRGPVVLDSCVTYAALLALSKNEFKWSCWSRCKVIENNINHELRGVFTMDLQQQQYASNLSSSTDDRTAVSVRSFFEKQCSASAVVMGEVASNWRTIERFGNMAQWSSAANAVHGWLAGGCCCHLHILCFYRTHLIFLYWLSRGA